MLFEDCYNHVGYYKTPSDLIISLYAIDIHYTILMWLYLPCFIEECQHLLCQHVLCQHCNITFFIAMGFMACYDAVWL